MASIFAPLVAAELTSLHVRHNWRTGLTYAFSARQWEHHRRFATYGQEFDQETILTRRPRVLGAEATRALYDEAGALDALKRLFTLVEAGRHQGVDIWRHWDKDIKVISNMHSNVLALGNRRHALRAGGIRRHEPWEDEEAVLLDGLNLSRAMTFKNAAAQIPYGGSKICVIAPPIPIDDLEALGFLAWCIDQSRSFTGPDMGFVPDHADVLREHFTKNIVGGSRGPLGPTGGPTARGVLCALEVVARLTFEGEHGLRGRTVAIQGLGAVGAPLVRGLLQAGVARIYVADLSVARVNTFVGRLSTEFRPRVQVVDPEKILFTDADIVSPNALGGVLGLDEIDRLRCRVVMGAANNQLRAESQVEEMALAERLKERGVLYQADWMHNTAGVLAGAEEWELQEKARMSHVLERLEQVCSEGVRQNVSDAMTHGITPTEMAYRRVEARIYPGLRSA